MRPGDLLGSGTISGPTPSSYGSLLELAWRGSKPVELQSTKQEKKTRNFLLDGDTLTMTGFAQGQGFRVGFGEVTGKILPASSPYLK
jgi:fumarylacetoacetase